jgi:cell fate (sporulation/competence/biofilm development) regulator YmcA (YheA/YmcA/DUF963 family)
MGAVLRTRQDSTPGSVVANAFQRLATTLNQRDWNKRKAKNVKKHHFLARVLNEFKKERKEVISSNSFSKNKAMNRAMSVHKIRKNISIFFYLSLITN